MPQREPGTEVVLYDQLPMERIASEELVRRAPGLLAVGSDRLYIPTEAVIGNYGVVGALLIDSQPEARWHSYEFSFNRWPGSHHYPESLEKAAAKAEEDGGELLSRVYGDAWENHATSFLKGTGDDDPEQVARFIATGHGFKMIRAFLTPPELSKQVEALGKHIGPALIQECFAGDRVAGDVPAEERMEQWPDRDWQKWLKEGDEPDRTKFGVLFDEKVDGLESALGMGETTREFYVSFHGWPWYQRMLHVGQTSLYKSIAQFDALIASLDRRQTIATRGLEEVVDTDTLTIDPPSSD